MNKTKIFFLLICVTGSFGMDKKSKTRHLLPPINTNVQAQRVTPDSSPLAPLSLKFAHNKLSKQNNPVLKKKELRYKTFYNNNINKIAPIQGTT